MLHWKLFSPIYTQCYILNSTTLMWIFYISLTQIFISLSYKRYYFVKIWCLSYLFLYKILAQVLSSILFHFYGLCHIRSEMWRSIVFMEVGFILGVIIKVNIILLGTTISFICSMKIKNTLWHLFELKILISYPWDVSLFSIMEYKAIFAVVII